MSFYRDFNDKAAIAGWVSEERAPYQTITVNHLTPTIGAEVAGVDLSREIPPEQLAEIRRASAEHLVLVFRDQDIRLDDQRRFARHFGSLHRHALAANTVVAGALPDEDVLAWKTGDGSRYTAGDAWHADVSCDAHPIFASFLRVTRLPGQGGGDTAYANMYLAYESLSQPFKRFLDGLTAIHDGGSAWTGGYGAKPEPGASYPASEHPVVARHPVTGRKFLYVNSAFTTHIPQLTRNESDVVLNLLFRHVERSLSLQVRVHWTPNALVFWDNWATQHHAIWDYYPLERWGQRVSAYPDHGPQA